MDDLNVTYITLGGYVEVHKYRYLYFVIMFTLYILIICCNSIIVYLIMIHQNLHEPMYVFIAALLINSVLYSTNIYPKLLVDVLSEKQTVSQRACLVQFFMYYSLGGSEFLLLAAMAYDRYVSICKPLRYTTIMTKTNISIFLAAAWLVPAGQVAGSVALGSTKRLCRFTLAGIFCNNSIHKLHCLSSRALSVYGLFILVNVALLPMLFIVFTYAKIFSVTYRSCREVRRKAAETCLPHLLVLVSFSLLCMYDVIMVRMESDIPKVARLMMTLQITVYNPLFNPVIYGLKMKEISKHLRHLFCGEKLTTHRFACNSREQT